MFLIPRMYREDVQGLGGGGASARVDAILLIPRTYRGGGGVQGWMLLSGTVSILEAVRLLLRHMYSKK